MQHNSGTITDYNQTASPEQDYPPRGHPEHWRAYLTLSIQEFFGYWKERYRSLAWVVIPDDERGVLDGNDGEVNVSFCRENLDGKLTVK